MNIGVPVRTLNCVYVIARQRHWSLQFSISRSIDINDPTNATIAQYENGVACVVRSTSSRMIYHGFWLHQYSMHEHEFRMCSLLHYLVPIAFGDDVDYTCFKIIPNSSSEIYEPLKGSRRSGWWDLLRHRIDIDGSKRSISRTLLQGILC